MKLSRFGQRYSGPSGIVDLMDDLGSALRDNPDLVMMAGGTPARIEAAELLFQRTLQTLLRDAEQTHQLLGRYQGPKGDLAARGLLAAQLNELYDWKLTPDHIAITNGGQSAFGLIANLLAGESDAGRRSIHLPLVPEYLGYADIGLDQPFFTATKPHIELLPDNLFKYRLDMTATIPPQTAALCISRPTNPSGNVLSDAEVQSLDARARAQGVPLIIDAAYGLPFPGLHYGNDAQAYWSDNVILLLSLSKVGLPGVRSGFVVAKPEFIDAFSRANTILNLASGNLGPALASALLQNGELIRLSRDVLRPWYQAKAERAVQLLRAALGDMPYRLHKPEGAFFLWLWLPTLPIDCHELYRRLRRQGLLAIPGADSFIGLSEPWDHASQCIRLSYAVPDAALAQGAAILAKVLRECCG
ncbi:MAG TPA: valine--pyruvate transaminase [Candidatus Acidoferrum sp.]|nr:valine--pyruvate transaminase [Candidatus Acidoferrum sp.]